MTQNEPLYSVKGKRVWVAGHRGMVGSALLRRLKQEDCIPLTVEREEVDLTRQEQVERWMREAPRSRFPGRGEGGRNSRK